MFDINFKAIFIAIFVAGFIVGIALWKFLAWIISHINLSWS